MQSAARPDDPVGRVCRGVLLAWVSLDVVFFGLKRWWQYSGFSRKPVRPGHPRPYRRGRTGGLQIANWLRYFLQPLIFLFLFLSRKKESQGQGKGQG
jgi:hypothetical protein